jgi:hypothetical protein
MAALTVTIARAAGETVPSMAHSIARLLTQVIYEIQSTGKLSGSISTVGVGLVRYQPGEPEKE